MRPSANSQAGRILALLEMGGWWSCSDLLKATPAIVHSRISYLRRKKGYVIEHKTIGPGAQGSLYRITGFSPPALSEGRAMNGGRQTTSPRPDSGTEALAAVRPSESAALHSRQEPSPVSPVVSGAAAPSVLPDELPSHGSSSPGSEGEGAAASPSEFQMSMLEPKEDHQYAREVA